MAEVIPTPSSDAPDWPPTSAASTSFSSTPDLYPGEDGDGAVTDDEADLVISRYVDLIALGQLPPPGASADGSELRMSLRETLRSLGWSPPSRAKTFDDVLASFSGPDRDDDAGPVAKVWRRVNPSKTARRQRLLVSIHVKMPSATHHQILQVLLFQSLLALLARSSSLVASFSTTGSRLQRSVAKWDRLGSKDGQFEAESARLSQEVDDFVDRLSEFLAPVALDDPSPTATGSAGPDTSATEGAPAVTGPRRMSKREAYVLERRARRLTSRSTRFHARYEAHRWKKDAAKEEGSALIDEMTRGGKEIGHVGQEVEAVVLELVILWKNGKAAAGKREREEVKGKARMGSGIRTRKAPVV